MRIGHTRSGSAKTVETVCRPSQRTGFDTPSLVSTRSPRLSVSTATSPSDVRISVPAMKQITSMSTVPVAVFPARSLLVTCNMSSTLPVTVSVDDV